MVKAISLVLLAVGVAVQTLPAGKLGEAQGLLEVQCEADIRRELCFRVGTGISTLARPGSCCYRPSGGDQGKPSQCAVGPARKVARGHGTQSAGAVHGRGCWAFLSTDLGYGPWAGGCCSGAAAQIYRCGTHLPDTDAFTATRAPLIEQTSEIKRKIINTKPLSARLEG